MRSQKSVRRWTKHIAAIAVTATAVSALAACAPGGADEAKPTLTLSVQTAPASLDPTQFAGGPNSIWNAAAYQGLLHITGTSEVVPSLAESYEWLDSANTQLQITLHEGLLFSDGTALNSAAVKTSIEHFAASESAHLYAAAPIESIETPDDRTVIFNLSESTPTLPYNLGENTGMGAIISPQALEDGVNLGTTPVGAGPYVLSEAETIQGSTYTYVPNETYYDQDAIVWEKVVIKAIDNANTALNALQAGQVDVTWGQFDTVKAAEAAGLSVSAFQNDVIGLWLLAPDGSIIPALGDVRVRQALQFATDRTSINEALTLGTGMPTAQSVAAGSLGWDESLDALYPYDVDKAKELLADAGCADGLSLQVAVPPGPENETLAQALKDQWAKAGVNLEIILTSTFNEWIQQIFTGEVPAAIVTLANVGMPATMENVFAKNGLQNPLQIDFADVVAAADAARSLSGEEAEAAWQEVNRITVEQAYMVPVANKPFLWYSDADKVAGADGSPYMNPVFLTPAN